MKGNPDRLAEAFMIVWENGYRIRSSIKQELYGESVISKIPCELLVSVGWDPRKFPENEEDADFLIEYYKFIMTIY